MAKIEKVQLSFLLVPDFLQHLLVDMQGGQSQQPNIEFQRHGEVFDDLELFTKKLRFCSYIRSENTRIGFQCST